LRAGSDEVALRVGGGVTGVRGGVITVGVEAVPAVRPFSTRISLLFAVDEAAEDEAAEDEGVEEFVFTKRCSRGS
jgi:hypothetical protein